MPKSTTKKLVLWYWPSVWWRPSTHWPWPWGWPRKRPLGWRRSICLTVRNLLNEYSHDSKKEYDLHFSYLILGSWGSEATPSATPFFKRAYKICHSLGLWAFWDALASFASFAQSAKIGLSKWIFYVKNHPSLSDFFFH